MPIRETNSTLLDNAITQMATLPGIGHKTAMRLVLNLLKRSTEEISQFANAFVDLKQNVCYCQQCNNISDDDLCPICKDKSRDKNIICIVADIQDIIVIENTGEYRGLYHVLGGIISPMEGIGPKDIAIDALIERVEQQHPKEIIIALPTTLEGDTTSFYIYKKLERYIIDCQIIMTQIARGVSIGNEIGLTDELTLGKSLINRVLYNGGKNYKTT